MAPGCTLDRKAPVCNAAVENFVRSRHHGAHRRKVAESRTSIATRWSDREEQKVQASRRNAKREQLEDERYACIERENGRLLNRMQEIERQTPAKVVAQLALTPGANCRNASAPGVGSKSGARVRELRRVDVENQRLLKKLQGAKPSLNLGKMDTEYQKQQKIMRMRCAHQHEQTREDARVANAALHERRLAGECGLVTAVDKDLGRLQALRDHLRAKADDEERSIAEQAAALEAHEASASRPGSRGGLSNDVLDDYMASYAGVIPANSRAIVDELLAEHAREAEREKDAEESAEKAKTAAVEALRAAEALDIPSEEIALAYASMIRRSQPMESIAPTAITEITT